MIEDTSGGDIAGRTIEALAGMASKLGVDMDVQGGEAKRPVAPVLNVMRPILDLQLEVAHLVRGEGLYTRNGRVVTVSEAGVEEEMDEKRFISFVPRFCVTAKGVDEDGKPKRVDLSAKRAGEILAGDLFKSMMPEVTRILPARLPVFGKDRKTVRLLPKGYDPELRVFVLNDAPEIEEWDIDDATGFLRGLFKGFPWGDSGRSMAAQVSAMVGLFCQMLFPDACAVPFYYYNANMEGSGKSILAEIVIASIYGKCDTDDFGSGEEFLKSLASHALAYSSYLFMDDVEGLVKSQTLNRWIVQSYWSTRQMHTLKKVSVPKKCMTIMTANRATLSDDLTRRAVIVDLFSEKTAAERLKERGETGEVTSEWLARPETRTQILSALWALVRHWADEGMIRGPRAIPSFVEWSRIVGGIVYAAGFGDPFEPAQLLDAGDKWQQEWRALFAGVVRRFNPTKEGTSIPLPEWCAVAREHGLYVDKLGELETTRAMIDEDPRLWKVLEGRAEFVLDEREKREQALRYMHPQKQASPFAKILRKRGGQTFDVDGKRYRFAERNCSTSTFTVYALD